MKKQLIVICSLFILGLSACQSQGKKQVGEIKDTTTVVSDESVAQNPETAQAGSEQTAEAAPADNIARLVELTLASKYKAEIEKGVIAETSRKFIYSEYDLNGDSKKEIFVGLTGPYFCGSGGCSIYLLDNQGNVITCFSVSEYSIAIDTKKTNGWNDLLIESNGKFHVMKFNGTKYPSNPSVQKSISGYPSDDLPRVLSEPFDWHNF